MEVLKEEYIKLKVAAEELSRLNAGGVDNWEWYGESLNPDGEPTLDEFKDALIKKLS